MGLRRLAWPVAFVLLAAALCWGYFATRPANADRSAGLPYTAQPTRGWVHSFYDSGSERVMTEYAIKKMIDDISDGTNLKLGPGWDQSPGYTAQYFTMNLLGITAPRADTWDQCASGSGNAIATKNGEPLGVYSGCFAQDRTSEGASVTLKTASKKAYRIGLSRPWSGGPWLVTKIDEVEYVVGP